ncbi:MAG: hypothetical protein C0456_05135 [Hyphomonas sp.]|uniref:hypothetical protein n=1 Tax=Hyphomonas sp. TaxID=87 RepID=UPI001D99E02E|nr:hypothetical protein [Hyphomonas sp.]MBA4225998.1 hypothetical protein [Hyphomonas sp.]
MSFRFAAGAIAVLAASCSATPPFPEAAPAVSRTDAIACNAVLLRAANEADALAERRVERMMVMRFASSEAMQAYEDETRRLRLAALRMGAAIVDISNAAGMEPDYRYAPAHAMDEESVWSLIKSGDACASELLK